VSQPANKEVGITHWIQEPVQKLK